ncbi:hypothetical protein GCM10020229_56160 [Kitasatospora albolonga]
MALRLARVRDFAALLVPDQAPRRPARRVRDGTLVAAGPSRSVPSWWPRSGPPRLGETRVADDAARHARSARARQRDAAVCSYPMRSPMPDPTDKNTARMTRAPARHEGRRGRKLAATIWW